MNPHIVLCRHGEAEDDICESYKLAKNEACELTNKGTAQVIEAATALNHYYRETLALPPETHIVFLSDNTCRSNRSAHLLAENISYKNVTLDKDSRLKTWNQGTFRCLNRKQKYSLNPEIADGLYNQSPQIRYQTRLPEGESLQDIVLRVHALNQDITKTISKKTKHFVLVSHQVPILAFLHMQRDMTSPNFPSKEENPQHASLILPIRGKSHYIHGAPTSEPRAMSCAI